MVQNLESPGLSGRVDSTANSIDLVTVFDAILTSGQICEKCMCLYESLMSSNVHKTAVLKKKEL